MITPTAPERVRRFEKYFPVVMELLAAALIIFGLLYYLLSPWYPSESVADPPEVFPARVSADFLLDCFILHDASGSANDQNYRYIEQQILRRMRTEAGDRISFAYFGGDTVPNPIQLPSSDPSSIEAQQGQVAAFSTTDFSRLFFQLREAIIADRKAQAAVHRARHADTIIIITDGIPDLSSGPPHCPDLNQDFIPSQVVEAFKALVNGSYATQEPIYVRLILAGAPPLCAPRIKGQWEDRLGDIAGAAAFQVLSYSELHDIDQALLTPLRRQPRVILSLAYQDQQRRKLDRGEDFAVQYSAQTFLEGEEVRIDSASIVDAQGVERLHLHALRDPSLYIGAQSVVEISPPSPSGTQLLGEPLQGTIYLRPESGIRNTLSQNERYNLRLHFATSSSVEVNPSNFALAPCRSAIQRSKAEERLWTLEIWIWPALIGVTFLVGSFLWYVTRNAEVHTGRKRLNGVVERFLVVPYLRWVGVLLIFLIPMAAALIYLESAISSVCIGLMLSLSLFFLEKFRRSPTVLLLYFTIEFLVLPFLHLLISSLR